MSSLIKVKSVLLYFPDLNTHGYTVGEGNGSQCIEIDIEKSIVIVDRKILYRGIPFKAEFDSDYELYDKYIE